MGCLGRVGLGGVLRRGRFFWGGGLRGGRWGRRDGVFLLCVYDL